MQNNYNLNNRTGYANTKEDREHDYAAAKISERSFARWFEEKYTNVKLEDVSEIREFQLKDIDFIATATDGREKAIEVKNDCTCFDGLCTGNVCFEIVQRGEYNGQEYKRPGWFMITQADWIFILSNIKGNDDEYLVMQYRMAALKDLYENRPDLFFTRYSRTGCRNDLIKYDDLIANLNPADYKKRGRIKIVKK